MDFDATNLWTAQNRIIVIMPALQRELNAADAKLGDGDTGGMLARVVQKMADTVIDEEDVSNSIAALAQVAAAKSVFEAALLDPAQSIAQCIDPQVDCAGRGERRSQRILVIFGCFASPATSQHATTLRHP
jgi:hypothetical protein